ncbi:hypothetical protein Q4Q35_20825 [Flavivirga aquimarina]|uniref:NlpE C-terminal OB domain-containing protein n=1 Tax=Flavivirga aquimarina TaxID=2027862 RepID=A0ABT8WGI2_9FLAO|nr:hypothetical protein [Flavivirga aquimarina]MDO5972250.1 hypothetical protein [Flavivirga aquimarina]
MKKAFLTAIILTALISCKKGTKSESLEDTVITADSPEKTAKQNDGLTLLKGDFVFYDGAAVLQTHTNIYGVLITDKMQELNKKAEAFKLKPTDMVPVAIRGKITNEKHEKILWDNKVEVIEILNVTAPKKEDNNVVKLGN